MKYYPDGKLIPESLPDSYKVYVSPDVPGGQSCRNCRYLESEYCNKFLAKVRKYYWCDSWEKRK